MDAAGDDDNTVLLVMDIDVDEEMVWVLLSAFTQQCNRFNITN